MTPEHLQDIVLTALEDFKAVDIRCIDVQGRTPLTDKLIIASGTSSRHIQSMADKLVQAAKEAGWQPLGVEGQKGADWVLVDLNDIIVHLMLPQSRAFYNLEKLWEVSTQRRTGTQDPA